MNKKSIACIGLLKKAGKTLFASALLLLSTFAYSQNETYVTDSLGNPLYVHARAIVGFNPAVLNLAVIDDTTIQSGTLYEFADSSTLPFIDDEYEGITVGDLVIKKIFKRLRVADTISISRLGDTVILPPHWASLIIEFPTDAGINVLDFCDSVRKFFPIVAFAHPDYATVPANTANDTFYKTKQFSLHNIGSTFPNGHIFVEGAWNLTTGDTLIRTGIFDSGILWAHEDFGGGTFATSKVKGGYDYLVGQPISSVTSDALGHGTKTAGIIGAIRNNNKGIAGIAGGDGTITTGTSLYAIKIQDNNSIGASMSTICNAIVEASVWTPAPKFLGLHTISHGWYTPQSNIGAYTQQNIDLLRDALRTSFMNGVTNVVARGNTANSASALPATVRDEWNISVGAHDGNGFLTPVSCYGQNMDVLAPGASDIVYTTNKIASGVGAYTDFEHTSAAAPHVAGVAALMQSHVNPAHTNPNNLAPEDVEYLIQKYARDVTGPFPNYSVGYDDKSGWGRLHADSVVSRIHKPYYTVHHFGRKNMNANFANAIPDTTVAISVTESKGFVLPTGTYATVDRHKFRARLKHNYSIPSGHVILGAWVRNSASKNLWQYTNKDLSPETSIEISDVTLDSATITGYIYNFRNTTIGGQFRSELWQPTTLAGVVDFAYTIYTFDPLANALSEIHTAPNFVAKLYPNPATDEVNIVFTLNKPSEVWFEVTDLQGKLLHKTQTQQFGTDQQQTTIPTYYLSSGMYLCKICTKEGANTHKLLILK